MNCSEEIQGLNNRCRTCLSNISDGMFINIFTLGEDSVSVADMLSSCTSIKVHNSDKLPRKLCGPCYQCLNTFYRFKIYAENVNTKLWNQIQDNQNIVPNFTLTEMKTEIADMGLNDSNNDFESKFIVENSNINECSGLEYDRGDTTAHFSDSTNEEDNIMLNSGCNNNETETDGVPVPKAKLHICSICSESFKYRNKLIRHLLSHGKGGSCTSNIIKQYNEHFKCDSCPAMFPSMNSLSAHKKVHVRKDRVLCCSICKKIFKKVSHLKRHEICHEANRPYKCSVCDKCFTTEFVLNDHINQHNSTKSHVCPLCSKSFSRLSTLTEHIRYHIDNNNKYLCPICGKKFSFSTNLNQHLKRHVGIKMFACSSCPKKFISKGELKCHQTTHTGQRSHVCDQCGSSFTKYSSLCRHRFRHTGIKPYRCDACSSNFISGAELKRHKRIHTGERPYRCLNCDRAFSQNSDLVRHKKTHTGKQYTCSQCTRTFRLKSELERHITEHYISTHIVDTVTITENSSKTINNIQIPESCE